MTKIIALIATVLLSVSMTLAQGSGGGQSSAGSGQQGGNDATTTNQQTDNHHDYGWLGLLGLVGLAGLKRRNAAHEYDRSNVPTDIRRAA